MKKKEIIKIAEEFCDEINAKVWQDIKADILRDSIADHGINFAKMSKNNIEEYCQDQYDVILGEKREDREIDKAS